METAASLTEILQTTGGWGLSAVLMVVVWRQWARAQELQERIFALLDKQTEIMNAIDRVDRRTSK